MDQNFISKVAKLFLENGAKTLTMDDVAKDFGMSKKTLYQMYKTKEALLEDVLAYKLEYLVEKINAKAHEVENAVEEMFCRDEELERAVDSNNSIFIRQLVKYYPAIFNKHMINFSAKFSGAMMNNIERGRTQGYYSKDFNADIYSKFFFQTMMSYDSSPFWETENISREDYKNSAIQMFLNAITTEKGKILLKN